MNCYTLTLNVQTTEPLSRLTRDNIGYVLNNEIGIIQDAQVTSLKAVTLQERVTVLLRKGHLIPAINLLRGHYGLPLKEAKELAEMMRDMVREDSQ